ncbi:TonB-dependent receptor [Teredinibacter sp. KSP-S5-2]|uniref:TonB-dependent receptor n=1 Tax=Teredinibacter sp. KSP-S5-2 TaxID=3034506 RepID=UPI0029351F06|nr:TonB-dependent receptor [Teredinibacter sp. KSP-S5-2]WNO07627.1 TonB-dependent receptor [Teredinibacter sp. KSP-S5-2]
MTVKLIKWVSGGVMALNLSLVPQLSWADVSNNTGLRVTTVSEETLKKLGQVTITLQSREGDERVELTPGEGSLLLTELSPGLYEVVASKDGYLAIRLPTVRVIDSKITPLVIKLPLSQGAIEEVLVLGNASARGMNSVGASLLDRESLRSAAGSGSDVLRALDGLPGLFSGGEFSSFTVRGAGPRDNLILVDGVPFDNVIHFSDSFGEKEELEGGGRYSIFAPNIIGEAEFQPGGWTPAYGGKSGSLLKLDVAEGNRDTASYTARLDLAGVELGYDGPSRIHSGTSVLFSARDYNFGQMFEFIGLDDEGEPKLTDVVLKTSTDLPADGKLNILAIYAPESFVRDIDHVLASDEDEPGNYTDVELSDVEKDNQLFSAHLQSWLPRDWLLANRVYHRLYEERSISGEGYPDLVPIGTPAAAVPQRPDILRSFHNETESGYMLDLTKELSFGEFSTGLHVSQIDLEMDLKLKDNWIQYTFDDGDSRPSEAQKYIEFTPELMNSHYERSESNIAAYINQQLNLGDFDIRFGARWEQDNFADQSLFSPRVGAAWTAFDDMRLTLTAGRYYQAPNFDERASDPSNENLENERIDQFSFGMNYQFHRNLAFFFEPYYQKLNNLIVETDGVDRTFANTGSGKSWGVDSALTRSFDNGWSADMKYSYNNAEIRDFDHSPLYKADFNREHSFSIGSVWEINDRWKISSRWKWASGQPKDSAIIHANVLGDGQPLRYSKEYITNNTERYDDYASINLRVDYRRSIGATDIIAFIDIINLTGSENPSSDEFNERSGKDDVNDGEMLPIFGLRLEW